MIWWDVIWCKQQQNSLILNGRTVGWRVRDLIGATQREEMGAKNERIGTGIEHETCGKRGIKLKKP